MGNISPLDKYKQNFDIDNLKLYCVKKYNILNQMLFRIVKQENLYF